MFRMKIVTILSALALLAGLGVAGVSTAEPAQARNGHISKLYVDSGSLGPMTVGLLNGRTLKAGPGQGQYAYTETSPNGYAPRSVETGRGFCIYEYGWYAPGDGTVYSYSTVHPNKITIFGAHKFVTLKGAVYDEQMRGNGDVTTVLRLTRTNRFGFC